MTLLVSPTEIDNNKNRYETSTDFATGDKINLAGLIANSNLSGDQDFNFVGANAFTDVADQLRYQYGYQPIGGCRWLRAISKICNNTQKTSCVEKNRFSLCFPRSTLIY